MLRGLITVLFVCASNFAVAAEFFILPGTKTLLMMGETKNSDIETLKSYLAKSNQVDTLLLKGPGGNLEAGYAVADLILAHKLNVTVPANTDCASACSLIFAAGQQRTLEDGARLGFHLPFVEISRYDRIAASEWCASVSNLQSNPLFSNAAITYPVDGECLKNTYQQGLKDIRRLSRILERDGISEKIMNFVINTPSGKMAWVGKKEAIELGLTSQ